MPENWGDLALKILENTAHIKQDAQRLENELRCELGKLRSDGSKRLEHLTDLTQQLRDRCLELEHIYRTLREHLNHSLTSQGQRIGALEISINQLESKISDINFSLSNSITSLSTKDKTQFSTANAIVALGMTAIGTAIAFFALLK